MFTFHDLEEKFGAPAAYQVLAEIEKAAGIISWQMAETDPEIRLLNACVMQDGKSAPPQQRKAA